MYWQSRACLRDYDFKALLPTRRVDIESCRQYTMKSSQCLSDSRISELASMLLFLIVVIAFGYPLISSGALLAAKIGCAGIGTLSAFAFVTRGKPPQVTPPSSMSSSNQILPAATFLAVLTWLAFYRPMLEHYWVGFDEPVLLSINTPWFDAYDKCCARPLAGLEAFLGNFIMPGKIDSLTIMSALERWILATSVFLLVIFLLPGAKSFALASGALMVVNPTELLRFTPGLSLPYGGAMMFLLLASCIFILSYSIASRLLLLLACGLLVVAFLHYETIFPVSVLLPALLWLLPARPQRLLWAIAWYSTTLLAAVRFILFFLRGSTYQSNYSQHFSLSSILENFPLLFKPIFRFISPLYVPSSITLMPVALGVATFVFLLILDRSPPPPRKKAALAGLIAVVAVFVTILPEVSVPVLVKALPGPSSDPTMRLEFTPGPFQAIAWASLVGWVSSFFFRARYWFAGGIALLVTFSGVDSLQLQARKGELNAYLDFQHESNILRAAAPIIKQLPADSVIFFVIPDDEPSPLGFGYHPFHMSCLLFGRPAYAGHYSPAQGIRHRITAYPSPIGQADNYMSLMGVENLVLLVVGKHQNASELKVTLVEHQTSASRSPIVNNAFGPCTIPIAKTLPNGELPFLLPKRLSEDIVKNVEG